MLDKAKLKKLDVGDIVAFDLHRKEIKKESLISTTKELYGENIPADAVMQIERELQKVPGLMDEDSGSVDIEEIQFLLWRSVLKSDPDITLEEIGKELTAENMADLITSVLPAPEKLPTKKKTKRKKKQKDN